MPEANIILNCVAIATIIICIASGFISYKLYVAKENVQVLILGHIKSL